MTSSPIVDKFLAKIDEDSADVTKEDGSSVPDLLAMIDRDLADLTKSVVRILRNAGIHLSSSDLERILEASSKYGGECYTWFEREDGDYVLHGIRGWPESYYWDSFPYDVYDCCSDEGLIADLKGLVIEYKHTFVAKWVAVQNVGDGGVPERT